MIAPLLMVVAGGMNLRPLLCEGNALLAWMP
jgi:hypothetical protein